MKSFFFFFFIFCFLSRNILKYFWMQCFYYSFQQIYVWKWNSHYGVNIFKNQDRIFFNSNWFSTLFGYNSLKIFTFFLQTLCRFRQNFLRPLLFYTFLWEISSVGLILDLKATSVKMKIRYELLDVDLKIIEDLDKIFKTINFFSKFLQKLNKNQARFAMG